jgi:hypothetical protein
MLVDDFSRYGIIVEVKNQQGIIKIRFNSITTFAIALFIDLRTRLQFRHPQDLYIWQIQECIIPFYHEAVLDDCERNLLRASAATAFTGGEELDFSEE